MKFLRRLAVGLIALAFASGAHAADMAVKAPPACVNTVSSSCGWNLWVGLGGAGNGDNADILNNGLSNSIFDDGMTVFAEATYAEWTPTWYLGATLGGGYEFAQPVNVGTTSINNSQPLGWFFFEAGGSLNLLGSNPPPTIFTALTNNLISPFACAGPLMVKGATLIAECGGLHYLMSPNTMLGIRYIFANDQVNMSKNTQIVAADLKIQFKP
jgi:hypothetical protein